MLTIENEILQVKINECGAELRSIIRKRDGREMLWQADPTYWKRSAPVLFPIVGSLWDNKMRRTDGTEYTMTQHGFARDMDFEVIMRRNDQIRFRLTSNAETHKLYPYDFELEIGYRLINNSIKVLWRVNNNSHEEIHFQIGAHPAFNYEQFDPNAETQGFFLLESPANNRYSLSVIGQKGCLSTDKRPLKADNGMIPIKADTFNHDALILEKGQAQSVTLLSREKTPYIRLRFDAPVLGLWSPAKDGYAPFVCIEPWYGRCDREGYQGIFAWRDWTNHLLPEESFSAAYFIDVF